MGKDKIELFSMDEAKLFKYLMFEKMLRTLRRLHFQLAIWKLYYCFILFKLHLTFCQIFPCFMLIILAYFQMFLNHNKRFYFHFS